MRCAALLLAVSICAFLVGLYLASHSGAAGWQAAALAAAICWFGSSVALVLTALLRGPNGAMYSLLFGMAFRMGLPLAAAIWLSRSWPALAEAGVIGAIIVVYLVTLVAETLLVLPLLPTRAVANESGVTHG
jgi:hypothetical protein